MKNLKLTTPELKTETSTFNILDVYPSQKDGVQRDYFVAGLLFTNIIAFDMALDNEVDIITATIGKPSLMDIKKARLFFSTSTWRHHVKTKKNFDVKTITPTQDFLDKNLNVKGFNIRMVRQFYKAIGQSKLPKLHSTWHPETATVVK